MTPSTSRTVRPSWAVAPPHTPLTEFRVAPSITTDEANALDRVRGGQQPSLPHTLAALTTDDAAAQVADPRIPEEITRSDCAGAPV